jgi:hypothetical protein
MRHIGTSAAHGETGPLIMSGSFGPQAVSRRHAMAEICRPVTIKVRPWFSSLIDGR